MARRVEEISARGIRGYGLGGYNLGAVAWTEPANDWWRSQNEWVWADEYGAKPEGWSEGVQSAQDETGAWSYRNYYFAPKGTEIPPSTRPAVTSTPATVASAPPPSPSTPVETPAVSAPVAQTASLPDVAEKSEVQATPVSTETAEATVKSAVAVAAKTSGLPKGLMIGGALLAAVVLIRAMR